MVIFVPYAAPGDELAVEITESKKRFARARIMSVLKPSKDRVIPPCPYHFQTRLPSPLVGEGAGWGEKRSPLHPPPSSSPTRGEEYTWCGGCSWQHIAYSAQLRAKRELVQETLERIGGLRGLTVKPVLGMKDPWRYRNKVQQPVGYGVRPHVGKGSDPSRGLISGFYAEGSHEIIPIEDCLVQPELSVKIINRAKALLEQHGLRAYDSKRNNGWIRHLLVRTSETMDPPPAAARDDGNKSSPRQVVGRGPSALLVFVTRTPDFPYEREIIAALIREFPHLVGIHQNIQPARTNVILGRRWRKIYGQDYLEEHLGRLRFRLSPAAFFQVNTLQAEVLYDVVKSMADPGERLLDLYTGVGTIALWLADRFGEVGGVEENPAAVRDAEANAELNGIENARFIAQPVEAFIRGMGRGDRRPLTVVLDPPRAGCTPAVLQSLISLRPSPLIYVSCDPGTLARDLAILTQGGYRVGDIQPVDLFPHTPHIETALKLTYAV